MKPRAQEKVQVLENTRVGPTYYRMGLSCHPRYAHAAPGQFVMIRLPDLIDPLLPRPFSIHRLIKEEDATTGLEILYKVVGKSTLKLSRKKPGDFVKMMGPLGSGFRIPENLEHVFIIAGGIGIAPILFLLLHVQEKMPDFSNVKLFLGAKSKPDLLCLEEFSDLGLAVTTTTDDGSSGDQCLVTDPVEIAVKQNCPDIIFACGPMEMLACVVGIAEKYDIPCQVSIETMMACGMGACLGCAVAGRKHPDTYLHACLDGPVFDAREVKI
jgi:dihydroorotate dehydrogenase electron transfer subunit